MMLNRNRLKPGSRHEVWLFIALTLACCVVLTLTLRLWEADIRIPFTYAAGDQMYSNMVVKTVIETGWFHHNPALAAPSGRDLFEFFQPYGVNFLLIRLLAVVADNNWVITLNLFILLSFFTATWSSWLLYRGLSLPAVFAGSAALLFAFLPYHFLRFNGGHLFLSSYFIAPLAIWLALRCASDDPPRFSIRHGWKELLVVLLLSNCGIYYALFGCFAILLGGTAGSIRRHAAKNLQISLAFILLCGLIILITMTPSLLYLIGGGTADFLARGPAAAEVFGLKLVQLLMPIYEHRVPLLAEISQQYAHGAPLVNENSFASLGVIGGIGFLCLLIFFLTREPFLKISKQFEQLSLLNLGLFLFGTIGGFGMLLAGTVLPQIRGYNRISVYIACLSLAAAFLVLHYTSRRFLSYDSKPVAGSVIVLALTTLGLLDTTSPSYVPAYPELAKRFLNDAAFVRKIEEQLPDNAMVFQTPHISLPEIVQHDLGWYRQLAGYLNSHRLRWSYGPARGSEDDWLKSVDMLLPERGIDDLEKAGFSGIYVERTGFSDHGVALESKLQAQLSLHPIESADGSLAFYPIDPTDQILLPLLKIDETSLMSGFWQWEGIPGKHVWAQGNAEMVLNIEGDLSLVEDPQLEFTVYSLTDRRLSIYLEQSLLREYQLFAGTRQQIAISLTGSQDKIHLAFKTDEPAISPNELYSGNTDPGKLTFALDDLSLVFREAFLPPSTNSSQPSLSPKASP